MNVIIIHDNASITGGAQKVAITEALALKEEGIHVSYFSAVGPVEEALVQADIPVVCLGQGELKASLNGIKGKLTGSVRGLWNRQAYDQLKLIIQKYSPMDTIVHVHGWSLALSPSVFAAIAEMGFRVALTCHDYEIDCPVRTYFNYRTNKMCPHRGMSVKCLCTNCDKRSFAQKWYRVIREYIFYHFLRKCKLSLIYLSEFNKKIIDRDLRVKVGGYIVQNLIDIPETEHIDFVNNRRYLFIGRLNPEKGASIFCEAVRRAGVEADVIGAGVEFEMLKAHYPEIQFHGWMTPEQMLPVIRKARCLVMSSVWYEGAPLTIPEMQCAYAMPCIVPAPSGAVGYIQHGQNGLIFESGNIDELVFCIDQTKEDAVIRSMSDCCWETCDPEQYSAKTHTAKLLEVYEKILGE